MRCGGYKMAAAASGMLAEETHIPLSSKTHLENQCILSPKNG